MTNTISFECDNPWVIIVSTQFGPYKIQTMGDHSENGYICEWICNSRPSPYGCEYGWTMLNRGNTLEVFHNGEKLHHLTEVPPTVSPYEDIRWVVEFVDLFTDGMNHDWEPDFREFDHIDDARQFVIELENNPVTQQHCGDIELYGRHPNGGTCPPIEDTRPMGVNPYDEGDDPDTIRPSVYGDNGYIEYTCEIDPDKRIYEIYREREIERRISIRGWCDNCRDRDLHDGSWDPHGPEVTITPDRNYPPKWNDPPPVPEMDDIPF